MFKTLLQLALLGLAIHTAAHPGEEHEERDALSAFQKRTYQTQTRRGLDKCKRQLESSGVFARAEIRRRETIERHRRQLVVRDPETVLNKTHLITKPGINQFTHEDVLYTHNSTCILNPEGETGPFYVKGEHIRNNLREGQPGVPLILDSQFIDVETCEPIRNLWWDVWNCNSTGVYSGVVSNGNGNVDDASNINATFLRGVKKTDSDGVAQFETVFPGHYSGRTTHHHVVAHLNVTILPNNTIVGGTVAHIGQLFYDQDLIYEVEATHPYNTNNITITTNADDHVFQDETENTSSDPVINYVRLGHSLSDGIFGYITIAVNRSATYDPNYSFIYTSSGGQAASGGNTGGGGGGGFPGNGTSPSGSGFPSGSGIPTGTSVPPGVLSTSTAA
jgi:protocatechuate 3,4-dioxygenase beta subunit